MPFPVRLAPYAWARSAACVETNPEWWDLETHAEPTRLHRDMCMTCPVLAQCALSAKRDRSNGVIRAGTACRRGSKAEREDTDEALSRAALAGLLADGYGLDAALAVVS